jgi:hypothetical protein
MKSLIALLAVAFGVVGCAGINTVQSDVWTYSQWPAERRPASYVFERLPSQQAQAPQQEQLEAAARGALQATGFTEVADAKDADVTVQVGARVNRTERFIYNDPFWWNTGFYSPRFRRGPFWGPGFGAFYQYDSPWYDREVAVLIRDRKTNQPLYEARASTDGLSPGNTALTSAMFEAALKDFPQSGINPRRVVVQLPTGK